MRGRAEGGGLLIAGPAGFSAVRPSGPGRGGRDRRSGSRSLALGLALTLGLSGCLAPRAIPSSPAETIAPPKVPLASATPQATASLPPLLASPTSAPSATPTASRSEVPAFSHVFIILMENKEYGQIVGNPQAPTIQSLIQKGTLLSNYFAIRHPSLPNYLALIGGSTFNFSRDCDLCHVDAPNLADQVEAAGRAWKAYNEDMPGPCFGVSVGGFDKSHDPFLYFDSIRLNSDRCTARVVSLDQLPADVGSPSPPDLLWIVPNLCHTMHDCDIASGDAWLAQWIPLITRSSAFQEGGVLFLTFDEGLTDRGCCGAAGGGQVATVVLSPWVSAGARDATTYTHYSLLRTLEEAWGLTPLGAAAQATAITGIWHP